MAGIEDILKQMKGNPKGTRFNDLSKVCEHFFGEPRQSVSSQKVFKTPWQGDPRINIQKSGKEAKPYQVKQVLLAINKLKEH